MAHDHDHDHDHNHDENTYYLEQLFTIAACAAMAFATCMWWLRARQTPGQGLTLFIVDRYQPLVLGGGIGLMVLVIIRAIALWTSVDKRVALEGVANGNGNGGGHEHAHEHSHDHGHEHHHHEHTEACGDGCGHEHGEEHVRDQGHGHGHSHGHSHGDHGHSHGWAPWRYVVLMLPVVLFVLNLPNGVLSVRAADTSDVTGPGAEMKSKGLALELGFKQLEAAAATPQTREETAGKTVRLIGQFAGNDEKRFTLARYQVKCCAADAVPLNAVIMVDPSVPDKLKPRELRQKWVEVTGQVQFLQRPSQKNPKEMDYVPAVIVYPKADKPLKELVKVVQAPANPYLN